MAIGVETCAFLHRFVSTDGGWAVVDLEERWDRSWFVAGWAGVS